MSARKVRLFSISTSPLSYDFEQAKKPGRTGWVNQTVTNTFLSDLLPGFSLSITHDLWRGVVGTDTAAFSPFLQNVTASFSLTRGGGTAGYGGAMPYSGGGYPGGGYPGGGLPGTGFGGSPYGTSPYAGMPRPTSPGSFFGTDQIRAAGPARGFSANVNYSLARTRPIPGVPPVPTQQSIGLGTTFSPSPFWAVSWQTQYNVTAKRFESHVLRLERDLHDWRAAFNFVRNVNGNVAFYFSIYLVDLPDLKFDLNQSTLGN